MPDEARSDPPFEEGHFRRADESDDASFYVEPRLVTHIDDAAIGALREHYLEIPAPTIVGGGSAARPDVVVGVALPGRPRV